MKLSPRLRTFALTAHVVVSVGWLGAVAAYLALAFAGLFSSDVQKATASYLAMDVIGWFVIVPACLAALVTGLVQSLGTEWGVFRHYWILVKLLLTTSSTVILLIHMRTVGIIAGIVSKPGFTNHEYGMQRMQLVVHPLGGLLILLAATVLSIYKPWGKTEWGRQNIRPMVPTPFPNPMRGRIIEPGKSSALPEFTGNDNVRMPSGKPGIYTSRGAQIIFGILLFVLIIVLHLLAGGFRH